MPPTCASCRRRAAVSRCDDCGEVLCERCDQAQHGEGEAQSHVRFPVEEEDAQGPSAAELDEGTAEGKTLTKTVVFQFLLPVIVAVLAAALLGRVSLAGAATMIGVPTAAVVGAIACGAPLELFTGAGV